MEPVTDNGTLNELKERFGEALIECGSDRGDLLAVVAKESIHQVVEFLKNDPACDFTMLIDLFGVDYSPRSPRFEVVYLLHSMKRGERLRLRVKIEEARCELDTVSDFYPVADWLERETWDMFGISFTGHPNLKRLLMYESFEGHPLRRDYQIDKRHPLVGPKE
ncbi:MAG: NADH-quinone oxidoreductase subunit C [Gemmatimonadota bacterium]|nr:NADH-quinone oxidoreductase subunit C [Gemmatimonadota bacterium]